MTTIMERDFACRALYLFCHYCRDRFTVKECEIINKTINIVEKSTTDFDTIVLNNRELFAETYLILRPQVDLSPTLTNYAGIILGLLEDKLGDLLKEP